MPLSSFLLKPMQRITRYPLLIKNVRGKRALCVSKLLAVHSLFPFLPHIHCVIPLQILEHTPDCHEDRGPLREALQRAEELCSQVNEGVREKENSDRLEWTQSHVQCEGAIEVNSFSSYFIAAEKYRHNTDVAHFFPPKALKHFTVFQHLVFNSLTNCLGPRKLLHSGRLYKTKSSRELWAFLFNDFLLLTHSAKPFSSSGPDKLFSLKTSIQLKMYKAVSQGQEKGIRNSTSASSRWCLIVLCDSEVPFLPQPLFLNEVLVKRPPDPSSDEPIFHVSHIDRVYALKTETLTER